MAEEQYALHVDDDAMMSKLVRGVLERAGYKVASARNTIGALSALFEMAPSVILLDVDLDGECGYELCQIMRETGATAPVAFITGNRTLRDLRKARAVGGDYFIVKPFTPAGLRLGIERATAARLKIEFGALEPQRARPSVR